jgi:putative transcriptional regulator
MLSFSPLEKTLKEKGINKSALKTQKVLNGGTYTLVALAMKTPIKEGLSISAINSLCQFLDCQPGDLLEYIPDPQEESPY